MIRKVLIPNRGEIAVRIINTAHKMGLLTVVTLSVSEKETMPAILSDEVHFFEQESLADTFLNVELIISIAHQYGADAIHPGYGFLSENALLAEACLKNKLIFVGPSAQNIREMGDKEQARAIAKKCGVAVASSWEGQPNEILAQSDKIQFPVLIKAAMGGGGKGMTRCNNAEELKQHLPAVARMAKRYFNDDRVYVELYVQSPRHIEVQVLADEHGHTIHLFERECSIQRRYQKIIEEAPAPNLPQEKREELYQQAILLCKHISYKNAGTVEFLVDKNFKHYFLEMNTRIQVEHPTTEAITGIDLIEWQFKIAAGLPLDLTQKDLKINGHAIEARIYAEQANDHFKPSPGRINTWQLADDTQYRIDTYINKPLEVQAQYDPMLAKLICFGANRDAAINQLKEGLKSSFITGIHTNIDYLSAIIEHAKFQTATYNTHFCEAEHKTLTNSLLAGTHLVIGAYLAVTLLPTKNIYGHWRLLNQKQISLAGIKYTVNYRFEGDQLLYQFNGQNHRLTFKKRNHVHYHILINQIPLDFTCLVEHQSYHFKINQAYVILTALDILPPYQSKTDETISNEDDLTAPLPGQITKIEIKEGLTVKKGDLLMVLEAMKMENHLKAWKDGIIECIHITEGSQVKAKQKLLTYQ